MTDYTLMIAATTGVCSYVAGIVTMGLVSARKVAELRESYEIVGKAVNSAGETIRALNITNRLQGRELAEYRAEKRHLDAQRRLAGEKGRASQTAKRLEREAAARELTNARHAEMRKIVGELV